jgi:hypothetical protein
MGLRSSLQHNLATEETWAMYRRDRMFKCSNERCLVLAPYHAARRAREIEPLVCFICSGACVSALRFKRASSAEHHKNYPRRSSRFLRNRR